MVETLYANAYTVHPYRHLTVGSMQDLERASTRDIQEFYDTYYLPNNATVIIVGDVEWRQAAVDLQKYLGPVGGGKSPAHAIAPEPAQNARRVVKLDLHVALPAFVEGYHMPADGTADAYPLRLAAKILSDGGELAHLYKPGLRQADCRAGAEHREFYRGPQPVFRLCGINAGVTPSEGEVQVEAELAPEGGAGYGRRPGQSQNQILRDFILSRQTMQSRAEELGYAAVVLKDAQLVNTELQRFLAVTREDIQRVAPGSIFVPENQTLVEVYAHSEPTVKAAAGRGMRGGQ